MKFKKKMVVAHRGASGYAHENTLLAFKSNGSESRLYRN